jgi:DNA-binding NarL/FixJ family response regulator
VWQCHSCDRARELWSEHGAEIDVVIADIRLRDGCGLELLRELREQKPAFFALAMSGMPPHASPYGFDAFLQKSFTADILVKTLAEGESTNSFA